MKAKVARKRARHATPAKKHMRTKKVVPKTEAPAKKEVMQPEITQPVAAEPQMVEAIVATFEEPLEFVLMTPEPVVEVFEV
jgi:hypothetical protein